MSTVSNTNSQNVAIAFALTIGAGLSTALGAAVVFIPSLVRFANRKTLAASLGLSAGVMIYVSFVEIYRTSFDKFMKAGHGKGGSSLYATLTFFSGVLLMVILNNIVSILTGGHHHHGPSNKKCADNDASDHEHSHSLSAHIGAAPVCPCHADDPGADLDALQHMVHEIKEYEEENSHSHWEGLSENHEHHHENKNNLRLAEEGTNTETDSDDNSVDEAVNRRKLLITSINTALAIGLHNFPEGLATFVATLADPAVGAVLAIAIAIHNIPEGLCVALPIYYATGSRWKAFGWAVLSGLSEPIAALLGWAILASSFSDTLYGVLFGIVAGMMVIISVKELLPTAQRYDPDDAVTNVAFIIGMGVMAVSLVLFVA